MSAVFQINKLLNNSGINDAIFEMITKQKEKKKPQMTIKLLFLQNYSRI